MTRLPRIPLALVLAAVAFSAPIAAQQLTTSHGTRTLTRTEGFKTEAQYRQAARLAEDVLVELMADISTLENQRNKIATSATGVADSAKKANADYTAAKSAFDQRDQQYRTDLAALGPRQAALDAEVQQQRAQAAAVQAQPQRQYEDVVKMNDWATRLGNTRSQLDAERNRLLVEHDAVEQERVKLEKQRVDAENRLKGSRDNVVGQMDTTSAKRAAAYRDLRTTITYLRRVRDEQFVLSNKSPTHSQPLEQAVAKLRQYDAATPAARK